MQTERPESQQPSQQELSSSKLVWGLGPQTVEQLSSSSSQTNLSSERSNSTIGNIY